MTSQQIAVVEPRDQTNRTHAIAPFGKHNSWIEARQRAGACRDTLPSEYRAKFTWRQLAGMIRRAAEGQQDIAEVSLALSVLCSN